MLTENTINIMRIESETPLYDKRDGSLMKEINVLRISNTCYTIRFRLLPIFDLGIRDILII
jgi:hypothetical protein